MGVSIGLCRTLLGLPVVVSGTDVRIGCNLVLLLHGLMLVNLLHLTVGYESVAFC